MWFVIFYTKERTMSTFAYRGVVYDVDSGLEVGRVPSARLDIRAWVAADTGTTPACDPTLTLPKPEAPRLARTIVDPSEDRIEREERLARLGPITGIQRMEHRALVKAYWAMNGSMSLDPSETSDAEVQALDSVPVFGMHGSYETTPAHLVTRVDAFVWLHLDAKGDVEYATREHGSTPKYAMHPVFRRTYALDTTHTKVSPQDGRAKVTEAVVDKKSGKVIIRPKRYWRNVKDALGRDVFESLSPEILPYDLVVERDLMAWIHRDDREVNLARAKRLDDASSDTTREWIRGAAAPKDLVDFDYERLLSNPDVAAKAARSGKGRLWAGKVQVLDRAFPGEQNLGLVLAQRLAAGDKVVSEAMLASWSKSMRHRFNVRRYVEAIAAAFGDDPREVFATIDAGRQAKSKSWAAVEQHLAKLHADLAHAAFMAGVSEASDGEWLRTSDPSMTRSGFTSEYVERGHALNYLPLVATARPSISGHARTSYVSPPKPSLRPTKASERGVFTMEEVVKGLLATVRRMPTPRPTQEWNDAMTTAWWYDQPESRA